MRTIFILLALSACTGNVGDKLQRVGAATNGAQSLADYDNCIANPSTCRSKETTHVPAPLIPPSYQCRQRGNYIDCQPF